MALRLTACHHSLGLGCRIRRKRGGLRARDASLPVRARPLSPRADRLGHHAGCSRPAPLLRSQLVAPGCARPVDDEVGPRDDLRSHGRPAAPVNRGRQWPRVAAVFISERPWCDLVGAPLGAADPLHVLRPLARRGCRCSLDSERASAHDRVRWWAVSRAVS